jgi:hypothetical protein
VIALLATLLVAAFLAIVERQVTAPAWVRERIEERIVQTAPAIGISFGQMSLLVQRSGLARVILWDVEIRNDQGVLIAQLSDIEGGLSPAALLRGRLELQEAQVSGALLTLRRDVNGRLGLALGDAFSTETQAPDAGQIVALVDQVMQDPRLERLDLFEADALTIRYEDQRAQRGWTADGGRLRLERRDNALMLTGDVALLGGGHGLATLEIEAESRIGSTAVEFGVTLNGLRAGDIATQSPALVWMSDLDAPIAGSMRSGVDETGALTHLSAALQLGEGVLKPNRETRALKFDAARTAFSYAPDTQRLEFSEIHVASPLGQVDARGEATLVGTEDGWPDALTGQVEIDNLVLAEGALFDRDFWMSGAASAFKLNLDPFRLTIPELVVFDPEFPVTASSDLSATTDGWDFSLNAQVAQTSVAQVLSLWPESFQRKSRTWVAKSVLKGELSDGVFALRLAPGQAKPDTYFDFSFDKGTVQYAPELAPVTAGAGRLTIHEHRLGLVLYQGEIRPENTPGAGPIQVGGSSLVIPDLKAKPPHLDLRLEARGDLQAVLGYIDNPAWRVLSKIDKQPNLAQGQAKVSGHIRMPLRKQVKLAEVDIVLGGEVTDVTSDGAVPGRRLSADRLRFDMTRSEMALEGELDFDGLPATGTWTQSLTGQGGQISASARLSDASLNGFGVQLPKGMLSGEGVGQVEISLPNGADPQFALTSNLVGIGLSIPALGWRLPQRSGGDFSLNGRLGQQMELDQIRLSAGGLEASGTLDVGPEGTFQSLTLDRLKIANWLDVTGQLSSRGKGVAPAIKVDSGRVDLRRGTMDASATDSADLGAVPMTLTLDEVQITDTIVLTRFRGRIQTSSAGMNGDFDAFVGRRKTPIQGVVAPQNGATAFRITGRDAGDILKGAGLLKTLRDGTFRLDMRPVRGKRGTYDGRLEIRETRLRNAPGIGGLLDAVSIVGLIDEANGPGIYFTHVDADFRLTPSQVILTKSAASGPSMGISMDGYYDLEKRRMDMQGVLSPIYFLNGIGQLISKQGEGLIGFNFELKGPVSSPQVAVNPLSALTPGFLREIFRKPPPKVSD